MRNIILLGKTVQVVEIAYPKCHSQKQPSTGVLIDKVF